MNQIENHETNKKCTHEKWDAHAHQTPFANRIHDPECEVWEENNRRHNAKHKAANMCLRMIRGVIQDVTAEFKKALNVIGAYPVVNKGHCSNHEVTSGVE